MCKREERRRRKPAPLLLKRFFFASTPMNNTNTNTEPIELFIACLLYMIEGICWICSELAGHHDQLAITLSFSMTSEDFEARLSGLLITDKVQQLRDSGHTFKSIGRELSISAATASRYFWKQQSYLLKEAMVSH